MKDPRRVRVTGPLAEHADGYRLELAAMGYVPESAACHLQLMDDVSGWLAASGLGPSELLCVARTDEFVRARRVAGCKMFVSRQALAPLVNYMVSVGLVPAASSTAGSATDVLVEKYRRCLSDERGLSKRTIYNYVGAARLFLSECGEGDGAGLDQTLERMTAGLVTGFVVEQCRRQRPGSAKVMVAGLRSLLRYLFVSGYTHQQLAGAVPTPTGFSGRTLPRPLDAEAVAALLGSCDRSKTLGRRDFAMLTVLARLCLRAGEVAALLVDDVDWHRGEVVVRGKGRRRQLLPLPVDIGEAVVDYLSDGRPQVECRALFLRAYAPITALSPEGVAGVVRSACSRAGISPVGPNHTACAITPRRPCCRAGPPWPRSAKRSASPAVPQLRCTPKSTVSRCGRSPCPGRERCDERARPSGGGLPHGSSGARRSAPRP
jgi:integrase/recombinase XerD